jgi:3-methyl-2-oxobutanoate hydroxymethyltransferase
MTQHPATQRPITPRDIIAMKRRKKRIAALTAYDYTSAQIVEAAGVPFILVGDTLGMVVQGHETTLSVTLDDMLYHTRAVAKGAKTSLVVGDMPFMTYQVNPEQAMLNAARLMQEGGCGAVKMEGGQEIVETVARIVQSGIPVCGHLGYTPQSTHTLGGPRMQGKNVSAAKKMIEDAQALEQAGVFAIVLELVPTSLAEAISKRVNVPTIGIGSGPLCDGEIQVFHDLFGLYADFVPRHTRQYLNLAEQIKTAAGQYAEDVAKRAFPGPEQSSDLKPEVRAKLREVLGDEEFNTPFIAGE